MNEQNVLLKVAYLVAQVLNKDHRDDLAVEQIHFDDHGNCIYITISGRSFDLNILKQIGEIFGDDEPDLYPESETSIRLVVLNEQEEFFIESSCHTVNMEYSKVE